MAKGRIPIGRMGKAEEFARMACFLCSDAGSFITGVAINVDGGASPVVYARLRDACAIIESNCPTAGGRCVAGRLGRHAQVEHIRTAMSLISTQSGDQSQHVRMADWATHDCQGRMSSVQYLHRGGPPSWIPCVHWSDTIASAMPRKSHLDGRGVVGQPVTLRRSASRRSNGARRVVVAACESGCSVRLVPWRHGRNRVSVPVHPDES